jgi:PAS domain S-box-containing protein
MKNTSRPLNGRTEADSAVQFEEILRQNGILDLLPIAAFACDMDGFIKAYNKEAALLWGWAPVIGVGGARYSGAYRLYRPNGEYMPHNETPVAACLTDGIARKDIEIVVGRPDHTRVHVRVNIAPLRDQSGLQVGLISCLYDITAEKTAEKELTRRTGELQDYVDNANIGLHWIDASGIIKWANQAEMDMLGYSAAEYIGHHISEFHVSQEKIKDILMRLKDNQTLVQYESELRAKDGSVKTVHISSSVFREDGRFVHTRCFTIDVTEQKKLYRALAESEVRYKSLVDSLPVAVYTCNKEGRITFFNEVAVKLWGYRPDIRDASLKYCACYKVFVDGNFILPHETPMAVTLETGRPFRNAEAVVQRPDGSTFYASVNIDPIYDEAGNIAGAVNVFQDISELRRAEQSRQQSEEKYRRLANGLEIEVAEKMKELKKSEDRYHKMIEEVDDYAIILLDREGIIMNWNKGAQKIKGYKEEEIVGKSFQEFYLPADREDGLPLRLLREAYVNGKAIHEGWRKRKDGTAFWGSIVLTALHDEENNVVGFSKVTRDLTKRKLAEDRTNEYLAKLEFQNKELEQFVYAASHDLKEPLRKIHIYNSFVAENPANRLDAKSATYLERSINATERMKGLIEDLLTYSRATANTEAYQDVDLNQLIDELVSFHKEEFEQKGVSIERGELGFIRAVPFLIEQLFSNLIDNAIKYRHPDRSPHITISNLLVDGKGLVQFKADHSKQYHKITVKDNGIGFDPRFAGKIFEIFQRLASSPGINGSGIGLAICTKIVQNHKGFIHADSEPGKGAGFHVYLPLTE